MALLNASSAFFLKNSQNLGIDYVVWEKPLHLQQGNKTILARSSTIRNVLAGIFLVLFAFGITPKLALHNLVAKHKDGRAKSSLPDPFSTQISKAGFNCPCDNLVTESPFVVESNASYILVEAAFINYQHCFAEEVYSSQKYCSSLRGPPAC